MRSTFIKYHISLPIVLIATALIAQFTIVDFDIGLASLRVYIIFGLFYLIVLYILMSIRSPLRNKESTQLFKIYAAFILWILFVRLRNNQPLSVILVSLLSKHFLAIAGFIVIQFFIRNRTDAVLMALVMTITSLLSAFVGVMQWFGIKWFWDLALMLHPQEGTRELLLGTKFGSWGFVPGLSQYSIPFSYHLITFGMFTVSWTIYKLNFSARPLTSMCRLSAIAVLSSAVLFSQSRSAIFSYLIAALFIMWNIRKHYIRRIKRVGVRRKSITVIIVMLFMFAIIYVCFAYSKDFINVDVYPGQGGYQLSRAFSIKDQVRIILAVSVLKAMPQNLLFGSVSQYEEILSESNLSRITSPHNMFLNALLYYGLPGLIFLLLLLKATYTVCAKAIRLARFDQKVAWVVYGAVAGLLAYILNVQFHNDSFVTGGNLSLWLLGLLCAVIRQESKGQRVGVK